MLPAANALARRIAGFSPLATQLAKQSLNTIEQLSLRDGYRYEQEMTMQLGKSEDSREAMNAFREAAGGFRRALTATPSMRH